MQSIYLGYLHQMEEIEGTSMTPNPTNECQSSFIEFEKHMVNL